MSAWSPASIGTAALADLGAVLNVDLRAVQAVQPAMREAGWDGS